MQENSIDSEKKVERKLHEEVKKYKGLCIKLETNFFAGLPDRLVILPHGEIFFAELKTTHQKARLLQQVIHNRIKRLGFDVYVIDTVDDVIKTVNNYMGGRKC